MNVINGVTNIMSMEEGLSSIQSKFPLMLQSTSKVLMNLINTTLDDEKLALAPEDAETDAPLLRYIEYAGDGWIRNDASDEAHGETRHNALRADYRHDRACLD